ncbi:flagellar biosynthetic protein FliO [Actinoplanes sp. KI2]|uniref:FliO/MopB family protein n=1 Tax=Actinoplanes sp. KI2 TaxID=2983315 RepID=UPI0021D5717F|nr:flagellar biosynthetic protein FliO [Actinoplanes sp. KI2]MCU7727128.1 flagellar biosynthetic protein FliO [Actinoplanes sp. KI2]
MFELVLRVGFSLFVVLGLMWALARVVRRPGGVGRAHGRLAVLNRQQLARGATVTVVKVADRAMILGVTDQHVSLLGEAELADFEPPAERRDNVDLPGAHPAATVRANRKFLDYLRDRTSRQ